MPRMMIRVKGNGNEKIRYFTFNGHPDDVEGWRNDGFDITIIDEEVDATEEEVDFYKNQREHDDEIAKRLLEPKKHNDE